MSLGCGAAAGATDILGTKSRSPGMADSKGTGDCPLGRGSVLGDKVSSSDVPASRSTRVLQSKSIVRPSPQFGSSFLNNPGWNSRWFHRPEAARPGFSLGELGPGRTSEDSL
jgi:hypothetical protein